MTHREEIIAASEVTALRLLDYALRSRPRSRHDIAQDSLDITEAHRLLECAAMLRASDSGSDPQGENGEAG